MVGKRCLVSKKPFSVVIIACIFLGLFISLTNYAKRVERNVKSLAVQEDLVYYKGTGDQDLDYLLNSLLKRKVESACECSAPENAISPNCYCAIQHQLGCEEILSEDMVNKKKMGGGIGKLVRFLLWFVSFFF